MALKTEKETTEDFLVVKLDLYNLIAENVDEIKSGLDIEDIIEHPSDSTKYIIRLKPLKAPLV